MEINYKELQEKFNKHHDLLIDSNKLHDEIKSFESFVLLRIRVLLQAIY